MLLVLWRGSTNPPRGNSSILFFCFGPRSCNGAIVGNKTSNLKNLCAVAEEEAEAATFTFVNRCPDAVWPGILSNAGSPRLEPTGFELQPGASRALPAPSGWSGRMWARTGCSQSQEGGRLVCATGDCGSGSAECAGSGAAPPATLAEFTLDGSGGLDFYDVSLVDGYNLPVLVEPSRSASGPASCAAAGCAADLNAMCPAELRAGGGAACRSACDAFGRPDYCCSGAFASPAACRPTAYSQVFKTACPRSYSYAFDDPTSTFTCAGGPDYTVTFCPAANPRFVVTPFSNYCERFFWLVLGLWTEG
ncbi:hypothetical protein PR202_gb07638 [Eleusine coracana subsp. coracana]|uniref:Thaumatin-like protein n=1 Tax=Eleusine coracana subsp. coracana TaxID=191504 RepID=A0AAV5ECR5_ELECO|nr:hypothetical protein PR202_gb07638 [Eleusine coracana subsp. coracana]